MRTTLNLSEELYNKAAKVSGVKEKTKLIHMGLDALIRESSAQRLAKLFGTYKKAKAPPRRKSIR